ncbi:MAG: hypothetical protein ACTSUE_07410 [Promethearchaeota archaeon]
MSFPGFQEEYQGNVAVEHQSRYDNYPEYYDERRNYHDRPYYDERKRGFYSGEDVIEETYAHETEYGDHCNEDPLLYQPAGELEGFPEEGLGKIHSKEEKDPLRAPEKVSPENTKKESFKVFLNNSHRSMSAKYAESEITKDPRKLRQLPVTLSASCVDEEIPKDAGVIIVNEKKFSSVQENKFGRNEACQKKLHSAAISYVRGLTGLDFSMITNPNVEKKISSFVMSDAKRKTPVAKLSPYVMWDTATSAKSPELLIDRSEGFPSINNEEQDNVIEAGYMVTVLANDGIRINGNYGGEAGKVMHPGQSLYFGDVLVFPSRAKRMPVWVRVASNKPSEITGKEENVSVAHMQAKMIPLRVGRVASDMKDFVGKAVRKLKIIEVDGSSSVARKKGEDTRVINAHLQIDFDHA